MLFWKYLSPKTLATALSCLAKSPPAAAAATADAPRPDPVVKQTVKRADPSVTPA